MKILKPILFVSLALGATSLLQAQEMTAKTPAKTESTIPPPGTKPTLAPDSKPVSRSPEAKPLPTSTETKVEVKEEQPGAKVLSEKNKPTGGTSTMATEIPNTVRPTPLMPNTSSTTNTQAPATREPKKTAPAAGQQKQQN